jgi:hypothetical protein
VSIRKPAASVRTIAIAVFAMVGTGAFVSGDTLRVDLVADNAAIQTPFNADSHLDSSPIPEPAALSLLGLGLLAVGRTVRARQRS